MITPKSVFFKLIGASDDLKRDKEKDKIFIPFCNPNCFKLISLPSIVAFTLSITSLNPSSIRNLAICKTFGFFERKNKAVPTHISIIPRANTIKFDNK